VSLYTDLFQYLMGAPPGQLPPVRRELHNIVMPVDLSNPEDIKMVSMTLFMFVKRMVPVRFGFVPTTSSPEAIAQAKVVHYLQETYGLAALVKYLDEVRSSIQKSNYVLILIPRSLPRN
jgi:UDP-glucose:glycoprotein glucosyltransferase